MKFKQSIQYLSLILLEYFVADHYIINFIYGTFIHYHLSYTVSKKLVFITRYFYLFVFSMLLILILLLFFLNTMLQFSYSISLTWKSPLLIRNGGYLLRLLERQLMSRWRDGGGLGKKFACMWFWWRGVERALTRTRRRSKTHETPSS